MECVGEMSWYLFGYEIPVAGCRHCVLWMTDRYGKTWSGLPALTVKCGHCRRDGWWIIDDVEYYLGRDPDE